MEPEKAAQQQLQNKNCVEMGEQLWALKKATSLPNIYQRACDYMEVDETESSVCQQNISSTNLDFPYADSDTEYRPNNSNLSRRLRYEDKLESIVKYLETCEISEVQDDMGSMDCLFVDSSQSLVVLEATASEHADSDMEIDKMISLSNNGTVSKHSEIVTSPVMSLPDEVQLAKTDLYQMPVAPFVETESDLRTNINSVSLIKTCSMENDQIMPGNDLETKRQSDPLPSLHQATESPPPIVTPPKFVNENSSPIKNLFVASQCDIEDGKTEKPVEATSTSEDKNANSNFVTIPLLAQSAKVTTKTPSKKRVRFSAKTEIINDRSGKSKRKPVAKDHRYPQSPQMHTIYRTKQSNNIKITLDSIGACNGGDAYDASRISDDGNSTFENLFHKENTLSTRVSDIKHLIKTSKNKTTVKQLSAKRKTSEIQANQHTSNSFRVSKQNVSQTRTNQEQQTDPITTKNDDIRLVLQQTKNEFDCSYKTKIKKNTSTQNKIVRLAELEDVLRTILSEQLRKIFPKRRAYRPPPAQLRRIVIKKEITVKRKPTADAAVQVNPVTAEIGLNTPKVFPRTPKPKKDKPDAKKRNKSGTTKKQNVESKERTLEANRKMQDSTNAAEHCVVYDNQPTISQCLRSRQSVDEKEPIEVLETPCQTDNYTDMTPVDEFIDENQPTCDSRRSSLSVLDLKYTKGCFRVPALHLSISLSNKSVSSPLSMSYNVNETDALANQDVEALNVVHSRMGEMHLNTPSGSSSQQVVSNSQASIDTKSNYRRPIKRARKSLHPFLGSPKIRPTLTAHREFHTVRPIENEIDDEPSLLGPITIGPHNDPELYPDEFLENIGKTLILHYINRNFTNMYTEVAQVITHDLHRKLIDGLYDEIGNSHDAEENEYISLSDEEEEHKWEAFPKTIPMPFCSSAKSSQDLQHFSPGISSIDSHDYDSDEPD